MQKLTRELIGYFVVKQHRESGYPDEVLADLARALIDIELNHNAEEYFPCAKCGMPVTDESKHTHAQGWFGDWFSKEDYAKLKDRKQKSPRSMGG